MTRLTMRSFSRSVMAFLALLSLLATFVPSLAWACPVTGRVGAPHEVCVTTAQSRQTATHLMACCRKMRSGRIACVSVAQKQPCALTGLCCHAVITPAATPLATTGFVRTEVRSPSIALPPSTGGVETVQAFTGRLPVGFDEIPPETAEVLPLHSQHASSLHSGRAPPFVDA